MPEEVVITRKQIIVVDEVKTNQYGDLTWTDKDNKSYKVKSTRKQYFDCIVSGQAVEISFSKYKNTEYPYSASAIKDKLPAEPSPLVKALEKEQLTKGGSPSKDPWMSKSDWAERDRITRKSIERQKSLEQSVNLCIANKIPIEKVGAYAMKFEAFLERQYDATKEVKPLVKSRLVEEALSLGAKIVEEGEYPFG